MDTDPSQSYLLTPKATPEPEHSDEAEHMSPCRSTYLDLIMNPDPSSRFLAAFNAAKNNNRTRIHCTDLPVAPETWSQACANQHAAGFKTAAEKEFSDLKERGTFKAIPL